MKIAVFHGGDIFIDPVIDDWISKGIEVRKCPNYSHWDAFYPDIVFFEFCTGNLVAYTNKFIDKYGKYPRVVGRLHRIEARLGFHKTIKWKYVDDLIFVSDLYRKLCESEVNFGTTRVHTIPNGVDLNKFTLKKSFEPTYKLAYVARKVAHKGEDDLPAILDKFKAIDSRYTIDKAQGQIPHSQMNDWLEDKDYLIHPSKDESFCYAVAEAMAKGIRPLIYPWWGAAETWGEEFFIENWNLQQDPLRMRKIIEERYNLKDMIKSINQVLDIE